MSMIKTITLIFLVSFIPQSILAQEGIVPGKVIVKFIPNVISIGTPNTPVAISSQTVIDPAVLTSLNNIGTTQLSRMFPSAIPGQTEKIAPITGQLVQIQDLSQVYTIDFNVQSSVQTVINLLENLPQVRYAAPDLYVIEDATPNDPQFSEQWYLKNPVNPKFDIDSELGWDYSQGNNIIIALIEQGIKTDHEDLSGHIWTGGGTEYGYDSSHGTYVAGISAATSNNLLGVAGVGWNSWLMPRRGTYASQRASDIKAAADSGAHVINNSWHITYDPSYLRDAVRYAFNLGAVITASMGNRNPEDDPYVAYPAAYDSFVVAVGALLKVDDGDTLYARPDMNYGSFIDITAPGDSLRTTSIYGNGYGWMGMTSGSTPVVSGVAALAIARFPNKTNIEIMDILRGSAVLYNGWENDYNHYGHGMVNAFYTVAPPSTPTGLSISGSVGQNPTISWGSNPEPDIKAYKVYRKRIGTDNNYKYRATVNAPNTSYTDNGITIYVGRFSAYVYYKIKAEDISDQLSPYSNWVRTKYRNQIEQKILSNIQIPSTYALHTAYPNPFNPNTSIRFDLPERSRVSMIIYDILGREIITLLHNTIEPGFQEIRWDGKDINGNPVSTGMYIYQFSAFSEESEAQFARSQKIVMIK